MNKSKTNATKPVQITLFNYKFLSSHLRICLTNFLFWRKIRLFGTKPIIGVSSKGRIAVSKTVNEGSNPSAPVAKAREGSRVFLFLMSLCIFRSILTAAV